MFGAAWGSGSPDSNGNGNDADENRSRRVDTRGPPDLNSRLPPTAPGSDGGSSGFFGGGGGGGGGSARERVRTVGPPDAGKGFPGCRVGIVVLYCFCGGGEGGCSAVQRVSGVVDTAVRDMWKGDTAVCTV